MYYKEIETDPVELARYVAGLKTNAAARLAKVADKKRRKKLAKKEGQA